MTTPHDEEPQPWGTDPDEWAAQQAARADEAAAAEVEEEFVPFDVPDGYRAGFVAVIGRPNVGKSSLVNVLVGERLAPVSAVPQTTRKRLLGILSLDLAQIVFVDTPGLHQAGHSLGKILMAEAEQALVDADLVLCVVDCSREPGEEDDLALRYAAQADAPRFLVINKLDLARDGGHVAAFEARYEATATFHTSALTGAGLPALQTAIVAALPEAPPFFPPDQVTDVYEREIAGELIREAALGLLAEELPHAVAVRVEEWAERPNGVLFLHALLCVERESQKGIVIGRGGRMLRSIGTRARQKLEGWLQRKVYLELEVKVLKGWRKDERALRWLGLLQ